MNNYCFHHQLSSIREVQFCLLPWVEQLICSLPEPCRDLHRYCISLHGAFATIFVNYDWQLWIKGFWVYRSNDKSFSWERYLVCFRCYRSGFLRLQSLGCHVLQWTIPRAQDNRMTMKQINDIISPSVHLLGDWKKNGLTRQLSDSWGKTSPHTTSKMTDFWQLDQSLEQYICISPSRLFAGHQGQMINMDSRGHPLVTKKVWFIQTESHTKIVTRPSNNI